MGLKSDKGGSQRSTWSQSIVPGTIFMPQYVGHKLSLLGNMTTIKGWKSSAKRSVYVTPIKILVFQVALTEPQFAQHWTDRLGI